MKSQRPDFNRRVHCLLGLPFDPVTLDQAVASIREAAVRRTPCFLSTPNLNFLIAGQTSIAVRNSVVRSDLSLADGMPIVWLARLMGIPIAERVAGSDLFEALRNSSGAKLKVYFFGGPPGVAERAARKINTEGKNMLCVGFESPGYGSIDEMSGIESIANINASGADLLVVALGAAKGQAWIERNLEVLNVPVVSHLGAVVNFVAGGVERAPIWMQKSGLEWVWRIREEPSLWKRYFDDSIGLFKLLLTSVVPLLYYKWLHRASALRAIEASIECDNSSDVNVRFQGEEVLKSGESIAAHLSTSVGCKKLTIKLSRVLVVPSDLLGLIQMVDVHGQISIRILVERMKPSALRQLDLIGCRYEPVHAMPT